jgi:prefoldin subunit 5
MKETNMENTTMRNPVKPESHQAVIEVLDDEIRLLGEDIKALQQEINTLQSKRTTLRERRQQLMYSYEG